MKVNQEFEGSAWGNILHSGNQQWSKLNQPLGTQDTLVGRLQHGSTWYIGPSYVGCSNSSMGDKETVYGPLDYGIPIRPHVAACYNDCDTYVI